MPTILPLNAEVSWPEGEGAIGVVGVAPWATLDFLKALYAQVNAGKDWHYPRVLCDINTKLPSRGRHLELGERDPSPFIATTIAELAQQGASVVVVPCNTAHVLYSRWAANSPVPVPHIVQATVAALQQQGARKAAVFASHALYRHRLYEAALVGAGIEVAELDDEAKDLVNQAIAEVKVQARVSPALQAQLTQLLQQLAADGVNGLVLGCTELAGLSELAAPHLPAIAESNAALAAAALQQIGTEPGRLRGQAGKAQW